MFYLNILPALEFTELTVSFRHQIKLENLNGE